MDLSIKTREMEAKREALLAKTLKRREQIEQKVEELEAKNAERRLAEIEKQEAAEQRKRERDLQRLILVYLKFFLGSDIQKLFLFFQQLLPLLVSLATRIRYLQAVWRSLETLPFAIV